MSKEKFSSWFGGGKQDEDKKLREGYSPRTRFKAFNSLVSKYEKKEHRTEAFNNFLSTGVELCAVQLKIDPKNSKQKNNVEKILLTLETLENITRFPPITSIDPIQDIAQNCLHDSNRWEVREIGLKLVLYLLNYDMSLQVPNFLLQAAVDFSKIKPDDVKVKSLFPDRSPLLPGAGPSNQAETSWIYVLRNENRPLENLNSKCLADLERISGSNLNKDHRDCIYFLDKILEFAKGNDLPSKTEHFYRWFKLLKGNILFLLYPQWCSPSEQMGHDFGYREVLPPILHYVIVKWISNCLDEPELVPVLLEDPRDYEFITKVIGKSFTLIESYSSFCSETASVAIKIYEKWLFQKNITKEFENNWADWISLLLDYPITLFDFSQDTSPRRINLCKEFLKVLEKSKENNLDRGVILTVALKLARKALETHPHNKSLQDVIEPIAGFLISLLADSILVYTIIWEDYNNILKEWSVKSEFITDHWLETLRPITLLLKENQFPQGMLLDGWLNLLKVLGDPLSFAEKIQVKWVKALQEIINLIVQPFHASPKPNFLLEIFFITLSRLIRQGFKESQVISLVTLVSIFSNSKCEELPMLCYLQHLGLLLYISSSKEYAQPSVLDAASKVLDYPGMHFLIHTFLKISKNHLQNSLKFLFYIMCLPNYYQDTKLENTEEIEMTYFDLKPSIQELLVSCVENPDIAVSALYGLTVFILEELESGNENISELVFKVIQNKCLNENEEIAITALNCLQTLSSSFPNLSKNILEFLISKCLSDIPNSKEKVIKGVLNTIQNWLLVNNSTPCESSLLSSLFSALSLKISTLDSSSPLENEISTLVSFISIYYLNFPFKNHNSTVFHSIISDEEFAEGALSKPLHYALGNSVIFTMIPHAEKAKFILRNQFGRFCWEAYDFMVFEPSTNTEEIDRSLELMKEAKIQLNIKEPPPPLHDEPLLPKLMSYIEENYPECYIPEKKIEAGGEFLKLIDTIEKLEADFKYEEKKVEKEKVKFNMGRYFVANMGLIDKLVQLNPDERFERGLNILDSFKPRESVKIGVIYVAPGQQDEREILANTGGSSEFQEFLENLGDVVDIREHPGNLGGLDTSGTAGTLTISYADWQYDVIFHIVPLMPTDLSDEQQVPKKRHVGNDIVHIVWSDHFREYRQDTMLTHFNFIIIVIYPVSTGIFRIQILKKLNIECGPLQDGMLVPAYLLPSLVRQTAIHANQQVRLIKHQNYEKQTQIRKKHIQELIQRYPFTQLQKHQVYASIF